MMNNDTILKVLQTHYDLPPIIQMNEVVLGLAI